jgi:hypothetical protein
MNNTAYVPAPRSEFMELARSPQGRLYKKQILKFGSFAHPNDPKDKLVVDRKVAESLVRNFHNGVCDIVQVPVVDGNNRHTEDPFRNLGEVVDLTVGKDGVYATIDARKEEYAKELGKTLIGASAMMHMNYKDTKTGDKVGPTLLHVAVTNRPYITNLNGFEEIIAASADTYGNEAPAVLTETEETMDKDTAIAFLRDECGIDVAALSAAAESAPKAEEIVAALGSVLGEAGIELSQGEDITLQDVAEAVVEVATEKVELANTVADLKAEADALRLSRATDEVERLIGEGKILPKQKDVMIRLSQEDRDTFEALLPEDAIVSLSEDGVEVHDERDNEKFESEKERLLKLANEIQGR